MLNFPLAFFQRRWNVTNPCLLAFAQGYVVLAFETPITLSFGTNLTVVHPSHKELK